VAALGLCGCTTQGPPAATPGSSVTAATVPAHPLPEAAALTDVVARMSDPAVPGTDKLGLIDGSSAADASAMDGFAKALSDNHLLPLTVTATDLAWSESTTGVVTATVTITGAGSSPDAPFSYPMEFVPAGDGWRLSRQSANQLFSTASPGSPEPASPAPASPATPSSSVPPR
jgi:hypothetical protein